METILVTFNGRLISFLLTLPLLAMVVVAISLTLPVSPAEAQIKFERRSVIELLFGPRRAAPEKTNRQPTKKVRKKRTSTKSKKQTVQAEKLENARTILVIGDFMAKSLSDGLRTAFNKAPGVVVLRRSNGSSGLVRDDYYDWPEKLPVVLDEVKPSIVIIMVGSNDRQEIRQGRNRISVRSEKWVSDYSSRVESMAKAVRSRNIPLLWVGIPPYKSASMSADMLAINGIVRKVVEDQQGEFIDIWDGFVDEGGKFVYTGSDIIGQQVRLRTSDGIRMTRAGRRKLAFYVEKPLRRLLGDDANEGIASLSSEILLTLPAAGEPKSTIVVRTNPIGLSDPALDGSTELLGASAPAPNGENTPRDDLVLEGKASTAPPGRADYFVWPQAKRKSAVQ